MLEKIKYILLLILCGQVVHSQAFTENAVLDYKRSPTHLNNYHGPVKSAYWYYTYVIDSIPFATAPDARDAIMRQNRIALAGNMYHEFDEKGRIKMIALMDMDKSYFGKSEINLRTASTYMYNETDYEEKNKIKLKKRQVYPVNDYDILIKINSSSKSGGSKNTHERKWEYLLDNQNRIRKEIHYYSVITDFSKVEGLTEDTKEKLQSDSGNRDKLPFREAEYIYDDRDNVKQLNIRTKQKNPIPFHFLDTETGFCPDLHIAYEYDGKDRMTQVTYFGCNDTLAFEKYVYHPEQEFVTERTRFIKSSMRGIEHVTQTMVFYHNENGDIIEKKYVRNRPNQYLGASSITLPESIYYTYEYDQYNNWVKCYIYMEGKPEDSEPTAIAQRDLEYYDS